MYIGTISENKNFEKRISVTPEIVKKYNNLGFKVIVEKDYGSHLGFNNEEYKICGAQIISDKKNIIDKSDLILQLNLLKINILLNLFHQLDNLEVRIAIVHYNR